jgi:hypothetical protein
MSEKEEKKSGGNLVLGLDKLFEPTLEYFGQELKTFAKTKWEKWKYEKQAENIKIHISKASKTVEDARAKIPDRPAEVRDALVFEQWLEGAGDVGSNEEVLSEMWEQILSGMMRGDRPEAILLECLKGLSEGEAKSLIEIGAGKHAGIRLRGTFGSGQRDDRRMFIHSLRTKGLLVPNYTLLLPVAGGSIMVGYCTFILFERFLRKALTADLTILPESSATMYSLLAAMLTLFAFISIGKIGRYEASPLGRKLLDYVPWGLRNKVLESAQKINPDAKS